MHQSIVPQLVFEGLYIQPKLLIYRRNLRRDCVRRICDSTIASIGFVAISPILALAILAILLEDGLPVFFSQRRVGRFGKPFTIRKLRTMKKSDLSDQLSPRSANDTRITQVGAFLRKTSVDELPQLINIIRGEMAIVGPRPEMPFIVQRYESWQNLRHLVTPGLTGLWQVNARKTISLERPEATAMDLEYIRKSSISFDVEIVAKTVLAVIRPKGAY